MYKKYIIIILVIMLCGISSTILINQLNTQSNPLDNQHELILTVFLPELQKASDDFYSEYLSSRTCLANYSCKVINLKTNDNGYYAKFGITPYIGPHCPVGYDEVEYFVSNTGTITLLSFFHKKNYTLPDHYKDTIKKSIPIS